MEQIPTYTDSRLTGRCIYCGGRDETREHVPSRILLDDPYQENLPTVGACRPCNLGYSLDEEYFACLIECAVAGSAEPAAVTRPKIRRLLTQKPALAGRLSAARKETKTGVVFTIETDRVIRVLLKLARGHTFFELSDSCPGEPRAVNFVPLYTLDRRIRGQFESPVPARIWQEVGSRALITILEGTISPLFGWSVVQEDRYRYLTAVDENVCVRIVFSEYLAAEVIW
jgi:hypothetical protein